MDLNISRRLSGAAESRHRGHRNAIIGMPLDPRVCKQRPPLKIRVVPDQNKTNTRVGIAGIARSEATFDLVNTCVAAMPDEQPRRDDQQRQGQSRPLEYPPSWSQSSHADILPYRLTGDNLHPADRSATPKMLPCGSIRAQTMDGRLRQLTTGRPSVSRGTGWTAWSESWQSELATTWTA
jgi:hypothetical protein